MGGFKNVSLKTTWVVSVPLELTHQLVSRPLRGRVLNSASEKLRRWGVVLFERAIDGAAATSGGQELMHELETGPTYPFVNIHGRNLRHDYPLSLSFRQQAGEEENKFEKQNTKYSTDISAYYANAFESFKLL